MKAVASAVLAAVAVVACEKIPLPVETAKAPIGVGPNAEIVDGSHGGGNAHFFFLPPLVPAPSFSGVFDASLLPVVRICRWTGTACATPPLAEFTTATGSGSEVVRVDPDAEQYIVNWHTGRFALDPALDYRIAVLVDGTELGHADVDVVASGRELRGVDRSRFVAVLNGQTLPIKFRIEQGALPPPGPFLQVDPGGLHTCGIRASGAAYCWGYNGNAQLGFGWLGSGSAVEMSSPTPVAVLGGLTFTHVSVGLSHACALTADGTVYCWGSNLQGQLGTGSGSYSTSPALVTGGHTFTMVDAGAAHTCGVTTTGAAYCWGDNFNGALGAPSSGSCNDGAGHFFPCSLTPVAVTGGLTFASVSAGLENTCGVTTTGAAYCWGRNTTAGLLGNGSTSSSSTPVAVSGGYTFTTLGLGGDHACAVTTTGAAYCWGDNFSGALGTGSLANSTTPAAVTGGLAFAVVSAGGNNSCGVTVGGSAYCWGLNFDGQLGDGSMTDSPAPVAVAGGLRFASIATDNNATCGVTPGRFAYCWGFNTFGQLGDGTTTGRTTPVQVLAP